VKACVQEERRGKIEGISSFAKRRGGGKLKEHIYIST
jgi:hypothetical protein